jgi:hypothetical protein
MKRRKSNSLRTVEDFSGRTFHGSVTAHDNKTARLNCLPYRFQRTTPARGEVVRSRATLLHRPFQFPFQRCPDSLVSGIRLCAFSTFLVGRIAITDGFPTTIVLIPLSTNQERKNPLANVRVFEAPTLPKRFYLVCNVVFAVPLPEHFKRSAFRPECKLAWG